MDEYSHYDQLYKTQFQNPKAHDIGPDNPHFPNNIKSLPLHFLYWTLLDCADISVNLLH
jgi:hypothetical protein